MRAPCTLTLRQGQMTIPVPERHSEFGAADQIRNERAVAAVRSVLLLQLNPDETDRPGSDVLNRVCGCRSPEGRAGDDLGFLALAPL